MSCSYWSDHRATGEAAGAVKLSAYSATPWIQWCYSGRFMNQRPEPFFALESARAFCSCSAAIAHARSATSVTVSLPPSHSEQFPLSTTTDTAVQNACGMWKPCCPVDTCRAYVHKRWRCVRGRHSNIADKHRTQHFCFNGAADVAAWAQYMLFFHVYTLDTGFADVCQYSDIPGFHLYSWP